MRTLRDRLWPRDRIAIALLLNVIWIPFVVALINYVDENPTTDSAVEEEREPDDFTDTVGWTWGVLWIGYATAAAWLARVKGRDPIRWGLVSLVTFIALFPILAIAPERRRE